MEPRTERIKPGECDELVAFLNYAFSGDPKSGHFEAGLPRMCRSVDRLCDHYVLREEGKIAAAIAYFPYEATVGNIILRFATVGNICTDPAKRGGGYMKRLMTFAMEKLEADRIDVSRLGGLRTRYERYGYIPCGTVHKFSLTARNRNEYLAAREVPAYRFDMMTETDTDALALAESFYRQNGIFINRSSTGRFYDSLKMWGSVPYTVKDETGKPIGYLKTNSTSNGVEEYGVTDAAKQTDILMAYGRALGDSTMTVSAYQWESDLIRSLSRYAETYQISVPSQFRIMNWERVLEAMFSLGISHFALPDGTLTVKVEGRGSYKLTVKNRVPAVSEIADTENADVALDMLSAPRFFFGPTPPEYVPAEWHDRSKMSLCRAWFPLPLSWNPCDNL